MANGDESDAIRVDVAGCARLPLRVVLQDAGVRRIRDIQTVRIFDAVNAAQQHPLFVGECASGVVGNTAAVVARVPLGIVRSLSATAARSDDHQSDDDERATRHTPTWCNRQALSWCRQL